jgi:hypothetical protein
VKEENEILMWEPPFWLGQIVFLHIASVKDDGVAFVQQASIHRRQTNSVASVGIALRKRRPSKSVFKIDRPEVFRPVENDNLRSYTRTWIDNQSSLLLYLFIE